MKLLVFFIVIGLCCNCLVFAQEWNELKGDHFIILDYSKEQSDAKHVLDKAEKDYRRIAEDLGYVRRSEFWTWSNRVKIYIYPDHSSYIEASGQPVWSQAVADYSKKER